jgi:protein gp37
VNHTSIEWCKNPDGSQGYTVNSKTGCLNHTPKGLCLGGLFPCYAFKLANGRLCERYLANKNLCPDYLELKKAFDRNKLEPFQDPFYPRWWPERLDQIRRHKEPAGIFLDDMSDWMGGYWPREWTQMELQVMRDCPQHRFYTLTKQPQNLLRWSPFPVNCWVGVTATNGTMLWEGAWKFHDIKATVRYISIEPFLEPISEGCASVISKSFFDWLIIGAQTKPYKPPKIEWVKEIVSAADKAGVPVFLKDNLLDLVNYVDKKTEFAFNKEGYYRQEMPKEAQ